jgi:hypothetical protein
MLRENKMIKMKKSQLAKIIREAQWGRFTGGAAPLDEPSLDSGPMSPEMQQKVFDMLVDSGSDPKELKASGNYPDVESLDSEVARRYFQRTMKESVDEKTYDDLVAMLGDVASPGWIKWNLEDGLTKDEIIARAKEGEERSRAHMRDEDEYTRPDYEGGEDRGLAAREYTDGHDGPNPPSSFPIRVGWDGGSYDAVDDEDLEMITRDLVSKGIAYSVDSVSDMAPEAVSVGADIEQFSEGFESLQAGKLRIKKSELTRLIREAFDVINAETGEINDMAPNADAVFNIMKRLGITPDKTEGMPGAEEVWLSGDDWYKFYDETEGKTHARRTKREFERLDAKNLMKRLDQWATEAGSDYKSDNPGADMQGVARDLAAGAKYSFEPDEWDELLTHFDINMDHDDSRTAEDSLVDYIADTVASQVSEGKTIKIRKSALKKIIKEALAQGASDKDIAAAVLPLAQAQDWPKAAELLLSIMSYPDLQLYLDDSEMADELEKAGVTWRDMRNIESAAWPIERTRMQASITSDPDASWLKFLGNQWTSQIEPDDMKDIKWKEYKRYIRLKPPRSISHGVGEIHVTKDDVEGYSNSPGTWDDFKDFLNRRASGQLGRRPPMHRSPPPVYD